MSEAPPQPADTYLPADRPDALEAATESAGAAGHIPAAGLGRAVGGGVVWMVVASVFMRLASFINQVLLGYLLTKADFGVFAIASGIALAVTAVRDGGLTNLLVQRGPASYRELRGPVFWLANVFNTGGGVLLCVVAPLAAYAYNTPHLVWMLLILGAAFAVSTPASILNAALRTQLRFGHIARVSTFSAVIRYGLTVVMAWAGFGPVSFVAPALACAIYEGVDQYAVTRDRPWSDPARPSTWRGLLRDGRWLMLSSLAVMTVYFGNYLTTGLFVSKDVVGVFFFAFSIVSTSGYLIAGNVEQVLLPSLSRLAGSPERFAQATSRFWRALSLLSIPVSIGVGLIYPSAAVLIWGQRWVDSIVPVQILSVSYPIFILHIVPRTALTAAGNFRGASVMMLLMGLGLMAVGAVGGWLWPTPVGIALATSLYIAPVSVVIALVILPRFGVRAGELLGGLLPAMALSLGAAAPAWALDRFAAGHWPLLIRMVAVGGLFAVLACVLFRVMLPHSLLDVAAVMPRRLGAPILLRLLRLRPEGSGGFGSPSA